MRYISNLFILFTVLALGFANYKKASAQKVSLELDTNAITLGDQIGMNINFSIPAKAIGVMPDLMDTLSKEIEIIEISAVDTVKKEDGLSFTKRILITSFEPGYHVIRPLVFEYFFKGDTSLHQLESEALLLEVNLVDFDETADIKDIKDILKVPLTFKDIWPYIAAAILLIALILLIIYYLKRRKENKPFIFKRKPVIPPHQEALWALEVLRKKKLWQQNMVKEFYTELTDIIRVYIERSTEVKAMEMTSDEIINGLTSTGHEPGLIEDMKYVLDIADLAKFAKYVPLASEHDSCFKKCLNFIKATMPKEEEKEQEKPTDKERMTDTSENSETDTNNSNNTGVDNQK